MFHHLLVPLDGSTLAEAILPDARAWAARLHARLTLLHISEKHAPPTIHGDRHLGSAEEAEQYLRGLAAQWSQADLPITWHVHDDAGHGVAKMLVDQATELSADLIALNTHGESGLREKVLGSIAQQVVHEGRVPVLLIRPQKDERAGPRVIQNILLPLDGDPVHETAIPVAVALADALGATIHLLNVAPTPETLTGQESVPGMVLPNAMRAVLDLAYQGGAEYLRRVRATIHGATTAEIARGDPAKIIASVAKQTNADLIVMATHGRMGLGAFWSASVAPKVLNEFVGPLLLLRAAEKK
ncbi:MAG: universal stress protein [Chloroflexota bacterium]